MHQGPGRSERVHDRGLFFKPPSLKGSYCIAEPLVAKQQPQQDQQNGGLAPALRDNWFKQAIHQCLKPAT
ncbi:hypothetical protein [Prochlorococcus marinus]|uniref:hypothetical protein n=1 Tax=Prochlorococcus marinus TaxID=1219 RepID=UPI0007B39BB0|nr:hypothetical protein [Prochlorococcus marinus]KZR73574.1 hypothetical protein PMIT1320_02168 [Prochlorococcus marinus str. MIT 1320]